MAVPTEAPGNLPTIQCKIVTVLTELAYFSRQDNDSSIRSTRRLPTIQGKIMAVPTEAQGNLPTIQWQDNDSSDRKKNRKHAYYSIQDNDSSDRQDNDTSDRSTRKPAYYSMAR